MKTLLGLLVVMFIEVQGADKLDEMRYRPQSEIGGNYDSSRLEKPLTGIARTWNDRVSWNGTNIFLRLNVDYLNYINRDSLDRPSYLLGANMTKDILRTSLRESLGQYFLNDNPPAIIGWAEQRGESITSGKFVKFFSRMFGAEETDQIASPFSDHRLAFGAPDPTINPGLKTGLRPINGEPYGFVGYVVPDGMGKSAAYFQTRWYLADMLERPIAEFSAEVPICDRLYVGFGAKAKGQSLFRNRDNEPRIDITAYYGFQAYVLGGILYAGGHYPDNFELMFQRRW